MYAIDGDAENIRPAVSTLVSDRRTTHGGLSIERESNQLHKATASSLREREKKRGCLVQPRVESREAEMSDNVASRILWRVLRRTREN